MDRFSPVAPAFIRVQVLPVGRIERARFQNIVQSLRRQYSILSLAEVESTDVSLNSLSPAGFRQGSLLFNYTTSPAPEQYQSVAPFELFREPLLILGIVDGLGQDVDEKREELGRATEYLREKYPRVVDRQLFVVQDDRHGFPIGATNITPIHEDSLNNAIRCLASRFISEFATYAQATQAMPNVQTPGATGRLPRTAAPFQQDLTSQSSRPSTPNNIGMSSPVKNGSPVQSPTRSVASPPPATNFDQINAHRPSTNGKSRSDSRASTMSKSSNRAPSQEQHERLPSHGGFGTNTSVEKVRTRGKARVGIVTGYIHLMAGQWDETLRLLIEHTNKARTLGDHVWHAKGLEGLVVCLILLAWSNVEFSIPAICYVHPDRAKFGNIKRLSQDKDHPKGQELTSVERLSNILPELSKMIMNLYKAGEGQLELPYLVIAETHLRFAKLLAVIHQSSNSLDAIALKYCVQGLPNASILRAPAASKVNIVEMLSHVQLTELEYLPIADRVAVLAGAMSVYALLKLDRRRAMIARELVLTMTNALTQARKLGAAEAGIHPAASLSAETSGQGVLATLGENESIKTLLNELASVHGGVIVTGDDNPQASGSFGNPTLRVTILRELLAFCEACPDPYGVLSISATLLRDATSSRSLGMPSSAAAGLAIELRKDEQLRIATTITRTAAVSRTLGLSDAQAPFWDLSLLRGMDLSPLPEHASILDASELSNVEEARPESSHIYVPNSSRPQTGRKEAAKMIIGQARDLIVTLQNSSDIALDVEALSVISSDIKLDTDFKPFVLGPSRRQKVPITIIPRGIGTSTLEGCSIQINGCRKQFFSAQEQPLVTESTISIKQHGQEAQGKSPASPITPRTVRQPRLPMQIEVIPDQPLVYIERNSILESNVMLLDGETKSFEVELKNVSSTLANIARIVGMDGILQVHNFGPDGARIEPGSTFTFSMSLTGRTGLTNAHVEFFYSADTAPNPPEYARKLSVTLDVTVNNAVRLQNPNVGPASHSATFALSFDLGNAWPKPLSYHCQLADDARTNGDVSSPSILAPGQVEKVHLNIRRWPTLTDCNDVTAELRERLNITWEGDGRTGHVDMKQLELAPDMLSKVHGPPIYTSLRLGQERAARVGTFTVLEVQLGNRMQATSSPLCLQFQIRSPDGRPCDSRQMAIAGPSQHLISPIPGHGTTTVPINICPLTSGTFDLVATLRPIDLTKAGPSQEEWETTQYLVLRVDYQ